MKKTSKLFIVIEECKTGSVAAEISAIVTEEAFDCLDAPVRRLCALDVPIPFSPPMEEYVIPDEEKIRRLLHQMV